MSVIRAEVLDYIEDLSDSKLEALKPLLVLLVGDSVVVETDLTDDEKEIIRKGRENYQRGGYISLDLKR